MAYLYCTANNTGKGFFTCLDRNRFFLSGRRADIWIIGDNDHGANWITRVSGVSKTKEEAQALVDADVTAAQAIWDSRSEEEQVEMEFKGMGRPEAETLP